MILFIVILKLDPMLNVVAWGGIGAANGGTEFANKITFLTVFIVKCEVCKKLTVTAFTRLRNKSLSCEGRWDVRVWFTTERWRQERKLGMKGKKELITSILLPC